MLYSVSQRFHFSEVSRTVPAWGTIYLPDELAEKYQAEWPHLLTPLRQTTQGSPKLIVREQEAVEEAVEEVVEEVVEQPKAKKPRKK